MTKRKQRSSAQWHALFIEHEQSNLTASEFCKQHNINESHFSTRKRQLRMKHANQTDQRPFIKLAPPHKSNASTAQNVMVLVHRHVQLQLSARVDPQWLAKLMLALS